jgi:ribose transport system substrate-binding protein
MQRHADSRRRRFLIPTLVVVGGLLAVSCGDDDDDDDGAATTAEGTAGTTAAPAGTDAAGTTAAPASTAAGATTAASGTTAAAGEGGAAEAAAIVEQNLQRPTSIELDTPVAGEIPTGLSLYFISCGAEACEAEADLIQQAADILEWEFTPLSTDGSPQQIQNAWEQVVREQPDGVIYTATPRSQIEQYITDAAANGTAIAACCITDEPTDGILWTTSTPAQLGDLALPMAAWVVNDAAEGGNDAPGVLYADLPDFPILSSLATSFEENFARLCPGCPYEKLEIGLADLQNAPDNIVSALRANTDLKYVIQSTDSVFTGLPAALSAAGLDDVKLFGEGPSSATLTNIENGDQAGTMAFAFYEIMFGAVDAIARAKAGDEVIPGFPPPNWILVADNIPSTTEIFPLVPDIVEYFTELWGKS